MAKKSVPALKLGDMVQVLHTSFPPAQIVELRGPLAPRGVQVYRVRIGEEEEAMYVEFPEHYLKLIPAKE